MKKLNEVRSVVRRELGLAPAGYHRGRCRGLAAAALLAALAAIPAAAQAPYQQELVPGFSSLKVGYHSRPTLVDLDGDADLDVVVGGNLPRLTYFENTGSATAPAFVGAMSSADPFGGMTVGSFSHPEFGDLDGDGDLDAVVGESEGTLRYLVNTGSSTAPAFVESTGSANPFNGVDVGLLSKPAMADLDGDGDLDAFVAEYYGTLFFFANTGNASTPAFVERTGTGNPLNGVAHGGADPELADLDGDGDFDAVVGAHLGFFRYFRNDGSSAAPSFVEPSGSGNPLVAFDLGLYSSPAFGDLDGDGDLDSVSGESYGRLLYLANSGSVSTPAFVQRTGAANPFGSSLGVSYTSAADLVDFDGDGDLDAVVGGQDGRLFYAANTGSASAPAFSVRSGTANPLGEILVAFNSHPQLVDLDGDNDFDVVAGREFGPLGYFENTGSAGAPAFEERSTTPWTGVSNAELRKPELADLDSDGDLDAVIGAFVYGLLYLENTGTASTPAFVHRSAGANPFEGLAPDPDESSPSLADVDGDGDLDAVIGTALLGLALLENTGTASAPAFVNRSGSANPFAGLDVGWYSSPVLVDLDNDSDLDLVVGDQSGRVVFFRSKANDLFADGFESGDTSAWSLAVP